MTEQKNGFKPILFVFGWIFIVLGVIGIALPLLPTTPFLILSMICFSKSSDKYYHWLLRHRVFGPFLEDWKDKKIIRKSAKIKASFMIVLVFSFSIFTLKHLALKLLLLVIGICVLSFIWSRPSE